VTTAPRTVLTIFGTRPEIIKLAPVIRELEARGGELRTVNVASGQHTDLLAPFVRLFEVPITHDLGVMEANQTPSGVCSRVLAALDPLLVHEAPDLVLVQGDTTTALAGALAAFHRRIPVGHVEAGLRSGDALNPYPEEMNRRLITRLATYHFAATPRNGDTLLSEGVRASDIFVTGNPVVDALKTMREQASLSEVSRRALRETTGTKRIVLTTHRRESFGEVMIENLTVLRRFVDDHDEFTLLFPVHPNPAVTAQATLALSGHPRIHLLPPLDYGDFITVLSHAWLVVSDSGGVQEEAPTLGKPLLILRANTERPEAIECGVARLVGGRPERLAQMLHEISRDSSWVDSVHGIENPFGRGDSGRRIARIVGTLLGLPITPPALTDALT